MGRTQQLTVRVEAQPAFAPALGKQLQNVTVVLIVPGREARGPLPLAWRGARRCRLQPGRNIVLIANKAHARTTLAAQLASLWPIAN